jgi:hypothetical protein
MAIKAPWELVVLSGCEGVLGFLGSFAARALGGMGTKPLGRLSCVDGL